MFEVSVLAVANTLPGEERCEGEVVAMNSQSR